MEGSTTATDIPEDLWVEILKKVHWRDLVFSCALVCKSWMNIVKSPFVWESCVLEELEACTLALLC